MSLLELVDATTARIHVERPERDEVVLGAFQRAASALRLGEIAARGFAVTRRVSGGPAVIAGPGSLHLMLALPSPSALTPCTPAQLVNRHVRPLLEALRRLGAPAHFFGRDWVSVAHRPAAWIGYAHHARSGRCVVEAIVAVTQGFALPAELDAYPTRSADPFRGKRPATLREAAGREPGLEAVEAAILEAYREAYGDVARGVGDRGLLRPLALDERAPWSALEEEAIGFVGASAAAGRVEIGGDLLGSEELPDALGDALVSVGAGADEAACAAAIDGAIAAGGYLIDGVKDRRALARVAVAARRA